MNIRKQRECLAAAQLAASKSDAAERAEIRSGVPRDGDSEYVAGVKRMWAQSKEFSAAANGNTVARSATVRAQIKK